MSHASHAPFADTAYHSKYAAEAFRPFEHTRKPGILATSLMAAVAVSIVSGAVILNRLDNLPTVNTADAVGPITQYTGLQWQETAARKSGVVQGRLAVLTPPQYASQPVFAVRTAAPVVEQVEAEITGAEAEELTAHLDAYPSADAEQYAYTAASEAVAADIAAAEAMANADETSGPEPRYILEDEAAPPAEIMEDDGSDVEFAYEDDAIVM